MAPSHQLGTTLVFGRVEEREREREGEIERERPECEMTHI